MRNIALAAASGAKQWWDRWSRATVWMLACHVGAHPNVVVEERIHLVVPEQRTTRSRPAGPVPWHELVTLYKIGA
jgi:hypothetical protein